MDGEAIATAFATLPGPNCLRDVLPKLGVRLKVYSAIKQQLQCEVSGILRLWESYGWYIHISAAHCSQERKSGREDT